jgi:hypothetical protein
MLLFGAACVGHAGQSSRISFAKGTTSASVEGAVIRGERITYYIGAKAGQELEVSILSAESNAVFDILSPMPEQFVAEESKQWRGRLKRSGDYRVVVGGTRGNAAYKLSVTIH